MNASVTGLRVDTGANILIVVFVFEIYYSYIRIISMDVAVKRES
jgi:uncharacterized DUF497 family protein